MLSSSSAGSWAKGCSSAATSSGCPVGVGGAAVAAAAATAGAASLLWHEGGCVAAAIARVSRGQPLTIHLVTLSQRAAGGRGMPQSCRGLGKRALSLTAVRHAATPPP